MDGHADRDRLDLPQRRLDVVAEVGLRQDDDGRRAALPAERQVALEPAQVQVAVEPRRQEDDVDVRRHDLLDGLAVIGRGHARELRSPRQDCLDERPLAALRIGDRHPVSDRGQVGALDDGVAKPARQLGGPLAVGRVEDVRVPMLDGDARGLEAVGGVRGKLVFDGWCPAESCKQRESPLRA